MVAGIPATMSFLWCLALPLFFCCWEAGAHRSSAGPSGSGHTELPAVTPEVWTSSEEGFQATDLIEPSVSNHISWETQTLSTQTFDKTFIRGGTISEAETREDKTMALMTRKPSKFTAVITTPTVASSTGGSPTGRVRTTVDTVTGSELWKVVFENLCTFDSSEEAKRILRFIHTSGETEALSSESSASSESSVPAITTSQALSADITALTKALVTYITNIKVINCRVTETEPTAAIPGTSHIDYSSSGGQALSPTERSALPDSTEAKSHLTRNTTSAETWTIAHATELVTPVVTVILSSTPEKETTAAKATTPSGTLVTVSKNLLEESSALSVETTSDISISGIIPVFTEDATIVSKVTSPAGFSAMVYSFSEETSTTSSTSSETSATHTTPSGPIPPISRSSLPSFHLSMVDSIPETSVTSAKTTASANSSPTASADSTPETSVSSSKITASTNSSSETSVTSAKTTASANSSPTASADSTPETSVSSTEITASANSSPTASAKSSPETSVSSSKITASTNSSSETSVTSAKTTASANSSPTASADSAPETSVSSSKITASTNSSSETSVTSAKTTASANSSPTASADSTPETSVSSTEITASANSSPTASAKSSPETSVSSSKITASTNSSSETSVTSAKTTASANSSPTASADSTPETSVSSTEITASANSSPTASAKSSPETSVSSSKITASTNSSSETSVTSAKTTDSAKTLKTASAGGGKPSTTSASTARTRWTDITPGADGGFLLLRLNVASPEDLTDPSVAERLMHQISHKLDMLAFPVQVSLLRVRSG
ncbi:mucin-20 [Bos javanicus]|uniref:mucin-20 n=1 Tax=Bos javanicus TaxID=9906 RepID=UPI002AA8C057|nr:mucin-20 [Bos javanicus]